MRRPCTLSISLLLGLLVFGVAAQAEHSYAFYYSRAAGQDLEITLLNTTTTASTYRIDVYDAWGTPLWEQTGSLSAHDAAFYLTGASVPEGGVNWGVVTVVSEAPFVIGLEYYLRGELRAVDVVTRELTAPEGEAVHQIAAYHTQVPGAFTSLLVMNPLDQPASARLIVYKSDGTPIHETAIELAAHESNSYNLAQTVGQGSRLWGLAEVIVEEGSVVVACKYLTEEILQVVNVAHGLRLSLAPTGELEPGESDTGGEDGSATSGKED